MVRQVRGARSGARPVQWGTPAQIVQDGPRDTGPWTHLGPGLQPTVGGGAGKTEQTTGLETETSENKVLSRCAIDSVNMRDQ